MPWMNDNFYLDPNFILNGDGIIKFPGKVA